MTPIPGFSRYACCAGTYSGRTGNANLEIPTVKSIS